MFGFSLHLLVPLVVMLLSGMAGAAGIEVRSPELGWVLLAPAGSAEVRVLDLSRRAITPLATLRSKGRGPVVAVHLQPEERRVWVLGEDGLDVHDAYNGRVLAHWQAPEGVRLEHLEVSQQGCPEVVGGGRRYEPAGRALVRCLR